MKDVPCKTKLKALESELQLTQMHSQDRRRAAAVLEVLAGLRTPQQAADDLGISLPTYYNMEMRAVRGLTFACCAQPPGRGNSLGPKLRHAQAEVAELKQQLGRYQALLRSAQRTVGLAPATAVKATAGAKRKSKGPTVRALRPIKAIRLADAQNDSLKPATDPVVVSGDDSTPVAAAT